MELQIREAQEKDALALIQLRKQLFTETTYLLLEPEEYKPTEESETNFIRMFSKADNSAVFLALNANTELMGFMGVAGGTTNRTKHRATVFLGVLREYWGKGAGRQLFEALFNWLQPNTIARLELTTAINNERAYSLYIKMGFKIDGIKKANIVVDGQRVDEYMMSYVID